MSEDLQPKVARLLLDEVHDRLKRYSIASSFHA